MDRERWDHLPFQGVMEQAETGFELRCFGPADLPSREQLQENKILLSIIICLKPWTRISIWEAIHVSPSDHRAISSPCTCQIKAQPHRLDGSSGCKPVCCLHPPPPHLSIVFITVPMLQNIWVCFNYKGTKTEIHIRKRNSVAIQRENSSSLEVSLSSWSSRSQAVMVGMMKDTSSCQHVCASLMF